MEEESEKRATGKQKKENKNRNRNIVRMLGLNDLRKISNCEFSNIYIYILNPRPVFVVYIVLYISTKYNQQLILFVHE